MAKKKVYDIKAGIRTNQARWDAAKFSPRRLQLAEKVAARLCAPKAKAIYKQLEQVTSVPWYITAVIHEREASQRWDRNIAQGDRWDRKSVNVPAGRGPFRDFKSAAIDALTNCAPYAARWKDWSEGGALTLLLLYNGVGPELYHNTPSGYLWAGTDQYVKGKYVKDGPDGWDPNEVDQQLGCAVLIKQMMALDGDVTFGQQPGAAAALAGTRDDTPDLDPDTYPDREGAAPEVDPNEPPTPTYEDGPPPASEPMPEVSDGVQSKGLTLIKDAIGSKVGTKTIATTATGTSIVTAAADDSWFDFISRLLHNPRFWIISAIVVAFLAYLLYNCVQNYKAKQG